MALLIGRPPERKSGNYTKEQDLRFDGLMKEYMMKVRVYISNTLHQQGFLKTVIGAYDSGNHIQVIAETMLYVLNKLAKDIGGEIDLPIIFSAGVLVLNELVEDIKATSRPELTHDEMTQASTYSIQTFLKQNDGKFNKQKLQVYAKELQDKAASGDLSDLMSMQQSKAGLINKGKG